MAMNATTVTFKFYAEGIPSIHKKEFILDTMKTWKDELKTNIPDWKKYAVKRQNSSDKFHEMTEKICILTNEYKQIRKKYSVQILEKSLGTRTGWQVNGGGESLANPQPSTSTGRFHKKTFSGKKPVPFLIRQGLANGTLRHPFSEEDYNTERNQMNQQNFDAESMYSESSQEELDYHGIQGFKEIKPRIIRKNLELTNSKFLLVQNEMKEVKNLYPNRFAKAASILPLSVNYLDLMFLTGDQ